MEMWVIFFGSPAEEFEGVSAENLGKELILVDFLEFNVRISGGCTNMFLSQFSMHF